MFLALGKARAAAEGQVTHKGLLGCLPALSLLGHRALEMGYFVSELVSRMRFHTDRVSSRLSILSWLIQRQRLMVCQSMTSPSTFSSEQQKNQLVSLHPQRGVAEGSE